MKDEDGIFFVISRHHKVLAPTIGQLPVPGEAKEPLFEG